MDHCFAPRHLWPVLLLCTWQLPHAHAQHGGSAPPLERLHTGTLLLPVALVPPIALTPEQLAIAARRHALPPAAKLECSALDTRLPALARTAHRAPPERKAEAEQALAQARQRYSTLRC